jgi:heavy metal sensor kinase
MSNSIRWTLLAWYAVILALVIGGFGATLYYTQQRAMMHEADAALKAHARTLASAVARDADGEFVLRLSPEYAGQFKTEGREAGYFAVWSPDGRLVAASDLAADMPYPDATRPPHGRLDRPWSRDRGTFHEQNLLGPGDALIVVGRDLTEDRRRLQQFSGAILATGAIALALALLGGWFLAQRALAPIEQMSRTASAISGENLTERIDVAQTKNELGRLAAVLNATFERLHAAFERQARFTADASHELRTPLAVVMSHAELALKRPRSAEEYREALDACFKAAQRMRSVVDGLLTLARADAHELELHLEPAELHRIVDETCTMLAPLAAEKRVELNRSVEPIHAPADRDRLRDVISNLVANAIRYNRPGGRVDVRLHGDGQQAVLEVSDTGIGIPERDLPHIFDRFYRVDRARSRELGGNGLGLAIARAIVLAHRGQISVVSREGEGTTFTVTLPLARGAECLDSRNPRAERSEPAAVLTGDRLVDD